MVVIFPVQQVEEGMGRFCTMETTKLHFLCTAYVF